RAMRGAWRTWLLAVAAPATKMRTPLRSGLLRSCQHYEEVLQLPPAREADLRRKSSEMLGALKGLFILPNKHACAILRHGEMLGNTKVFLRVRRHMPKRTTYLLRWSEEQQSYEMMGDLPDAEIPQPTSPEWLAWLSGISSFAFVCRSGT